MPTRRQVLGTLSSAAACTIAATTTGCARKASAAPVVPITSTAPPPPAARGGYAARPLPFDPSHVPGLSEALLRSHYDNNYAGAVRKLDGVRERLAELPPDAPGYVLHGLLQGELAFKHSVVLHELYFGNLGGDGRMEGTTVQRLSDHFGGAAAWEQRFRAMGASLGGGSGWAIIEYDLHEQVPRMYTAADHTQGLSSGLPLLVLDMYEHSYHMDYGTAAARYIDAFFANLQWSEVDARLEHALKMIHT